MPAGRREVRRDRRPLARRLCAAWLVAGWGVVAAAETQDGAEATSLHLSGFGTLGVVHVNAPAGAGFEREEVERANDGGTRADIDTRLGVQANYRVSPQFELVGQLVVANRVSSAPASDAVTLAFAAWRPNDDFTLRAGRISSDYYLLADYRNVGFAYPFVRPPVENYGALPHFVDGIDLARAWHVDETVWKVRGVLGQSQVSTRQSDDAIALRPVYALVLSGDDGDGLSMRASVVRVWVHSGALAAQPLTQALRGIATLPEASVAAEAARLAAAFDEDGRPLTYSSLGVSFDRGAWLASLEVARRVPQGGSPETSGAGLVGHRWGALTAFVGLSAIRTQQSRSLPQWTAALTPLIGAAAAAQAQQVGASARAAASTTNANQRTSTLGVRWDFSDRKALKLQWDRVRVDAYATRLWTNSTPGEPIHANVVSATLDFVF